MTVDSDTKGVITFSLRKYIKEKKHLMPCNIPNIPDWHDIFTMFMNTYDTVLDWRTDGIHITQLDESSDIDRSIYLSFKTKLCIAVSQGKKEIDLPVNNRHSHTLYWISILKAIKAVKQTMNTSIHIVSDRSLRIGTRYSLF